ncbi:methyltransferase domain-containing protein [Streptomyces sp. NP160]|uniref:class I SAM-dependent methyltransferase n=1 Tax=Streptomyces sp. NP160 TaxID=2586637 RepID=UPI00111AE71C|nr:class I SAM-dependent methyltransferase [Streptomyces sp. NP160]TNM61116.1 methyltransferase domain-containing protein [Streptomyces sp. NP160]
MAAPAVASTALRTLDALNARHPWSHDDVYAPVVLHHARRVAAEGGTRAVDVGCGTGNLLRQLARVLPRVTGVEPDERCADLAASATAALPNVEVRHAPFEALPERSVDLLTFVASLHHLPLEPTLAAARVALRPGGRLVVVGCYRDTRADRYHSWVSVALNPLVGLVRHPRTATEHPAHMTAPTREAAEPYVEIAAALRTQLPGVRVRRWLFWRYVAVWTAPR